MSELRFFEQIESQDLALVGGKALSLARMTTTGLPVPRGFCLTTQAYVRLGGKTIPDGDPLVDSLTRAYHQLGGGPVAVRSSATAEDGAVTSFAGQQETFLGVVGVPALLRAVEKCWASLESQRATAYRQQQLVREADHRMAVVIQRLIPAEVAGVLFTRDPLDPSGHQMLVEASWGLGESVVSGRVTPDRYHLHRETGQLLDQRIANKTVQRRRESEEAVPEDRQLLPCLDENQLVRLAELGRFVEELHGEPRDIEWAYADGTFWLLQSRPITAGGFAEREQLRQEEIARLRSKVESRGTVWSRYNLAEILPTPTPMTWEIVRRYLMSGKGGFGQMYRDLGYDPDPALDEEGIFDLICGRPYCHLGREARMHYHQVPFEHSFADLKADPRRAMYPTPTINVAQFPWSFWVFLPLTLPRILWSIWRGNRLRQHLYSTFPARFSEDIVPEFVKAVQQGRTVDLRALDDAGVLDFLHQWIDRTLVQFARDSLKPTALAGLGLANLEQKLAEVLGTDSAASLVRRLVGGVKPPPEADLAAAMVQLATGTWPQAEFLALFGHRGSEEMELSRPRWGEQSQSLGQPNNAPVPSRESLSLEEILKTETRLNAEQRALVIPWVEHLHRHLGQREAGKHYLMMGYDLIRKGLLELDQRYHLDKGIFYLTLEELPLLLRGEDLSSRIVERRRRRTLLLGIEVPQVIFSDDLEAIGRPVPVSDGDGWQGVPLSSGVVEGMTLVLEHPHVAPEAGENYILVCPSTDPAWVPLFVRAAGLVMETGGVLSHGAIVAREFGLPAVAGIPGIVQRLRTGQRIRVDGGQGTVTLLDDPAT